MEKSGEPLFDRYKTRTAVYGHVIHMAIFEPAKVVRVALQDVTSTVGLMITTAAMIAEKPGKEAHTPPGMEGMGGY